MEKTCEQICYLSFFLLIEFILASQSQVVLVMAAIQSPDTPSLSWNGG